MAPPRATASRRRLRQRRRCMRLPCWANTPHTLDSLPLDLSRNFADLRELDAVLSASMSSITTKISTLTDMIEKGVGKQEERLWLLMEIAEEATRLRLGGEDKIRVACQAADNLRSHSSHLRTLTEHIPGFDINSLSRRTTYPHVSARSFMPVSALEPGRRRRTVFAASLLVSAPDPSPAKRKRAVRDDDLDHRTPRKERAVEAGPRPRNGGRKKVERAPSPTESVLSVTEHIPPQSNTRGSGGTNSRAANGTAKRSRTTATRGASNQPPNEYYNANGTPNEHPNGHSAAAGNARREAFNVPPSSSSHPSLVPYQNGHATPFDLHARGGHSLSNTPAPGAGDWNPPHPQTLEGPGMPVARNHANNNNIPSSGPSLDNAPPDAGDGEADGDDKPYCICQRVSFGQMIACDDASCQWEWFHVACVGLSALPEGRWFCDQCKAKRNAKRAGRGGRRKPAARARA
ncbi:Chromatin modification-related protein [Mycena sanguinolenta]|uniref:Chromatin modification-related protein n=1 Tax=Mycena sanguinolenta TaxID=230812 RepID=A0A8H6XA96_9AGAR|nr:Chromatin modification-related protein [Mycena sanguinolenta]